MLVQSGSGDGDTSLFIYLREDAEDGVLKLAFSAGDMLWGSGGSRRFHGQEPSLKALENGSLAITEQNWGVGRNRWTSTATVAWRGERFIVAGYTYNRAVSFSATTIALDDWKSEYGENPGLRICRDSH